VQFHFDFGSPNAYLSHLIIPSIEARTGVQLEYVPVLLGGVFKLTSNRSPLESFAGIRNKLEYQHLETERFIRRHGITRYQHNPFFPVNTLTIMRGAVAAQRLGVFVPYVAGVFDDMWGEPKKMDDLEVIRTALTNRGLDAQRILESTQDPIVKQQLLDNTEASVRRGAFGSPTFFVDEQMYFGKDRLTDVEAAIAAQC
jgi:2-hydroxychromene-2-carboxylate isomerase